MGTFTVPIEVGDPSGARFEDVDALVDTGASHTVLPERLLHDLGVAPHERALFTLADGREVELAIGRTWVRIDGRDEITPVVFGSGAAALLGAVTLEQLRLAVDPVAQRLKPVPGLLMRVAA